MLPAATVVRPDWWIRWFLSPTRVLQSKKRERQDKHLLPAPHDSWLKRASEARRGQALTSSCPCSGWLPPSNSHPLWGTKMRRWLVYFEYETTPAWEAANVAVTTPLSPLPLPQAPHNYCWADTDKDCKEWCGSSRSPMQALPEDSS